MWTVDQFYAVLIYLWSELDKIALGAGITAYTVSTLRGGRRQRESLLCGVFAVIAIASISFIASLVGIPSDGIVNQVVTGGSSFIGGAIGWYGTNTTVKYLEGKVGGKDDSDTG